MSLGTRSTSLTRTLRRYHLGLLILNLSYPTAFMVWGTKGRMQVHIHISMMAVEAAQQTGTIENATETTHGSLSDEEEALQETLDTATGIAGGSITSKWSESGATR